MSSTLTVQDGIIFASALIKQQQLNVNNLQPGLGMAQIVVSRILGAPCVWRFNRSNIAIVISAAGGTDYTIAIPTLGAIEEMWLTDVSGNVYSLQGAVALPKSSASMRPTKVAAQYDDNAGNITFRFNGLPDATYTAFFDFQRKAPVLTSYAFSWGGVPDEFAHVFLTGMLAWAACLVNDARFPIWEKQFLGSLLGAQDGLDDQAKAILIGDWMNMTRTVQRTASLTAAGSAGRSQ